MPGCGILVASRAQPAVDWPATAADVPRIVSMMMRSRGRLTWISAALTLLGSYGAIVGVLGLSVGAFVGPQILAAALIHIVVAAVCFVALAKLARGSRGR